MKSSGNSQENITRIRIKGPYSANETELLRSYISAGLLKLRDTGKGVNYEEFCLSIADGIPYSIIAPEFIQYWRTWESRFRQHKSLGKTRKRVFEECIQDLVNKGLLPSKIIGLTGNFSNRIEEILTKNPTL